MIKSLHNGRADLWVSRQDLAAVSLEELRHAAQQTGELLGSREAERSSNDVRHFRSSITLNHPDVWISLFDTAVRLANWTWSIDIFLIPTGPEM